jgi:hypothetical protein
MIGLDTNLLMRYPAKDEPSQYHKVKRLIDDVVAKDERLLIRNRSQEGYGEGGIRTPGTLPGTVVFKTTAIDHSATSPR